MKYIFCLFVVCLTLEVIVGPPVDQKKKDEEKKQERETSDALDEYGLEYGRYLQQVVQALEEDKDFAKKLENISAEHIRSGHIAKELEFVKHNVRSKLDELKRMEVDRLRKLLQQQMERTELGLDRNRVKIPSHLDIENPHSFEIEDLKKLIQTATSDLEELDKKRRAEFKQYEMEKEAQYRESLKNMTEEEKKETEKHHQEMIEKHKDHPRVHHPGSKPQLEQVWEEQDHMPKEEFNPKTFFAMHDVNGDGHLDVQEVEAILIPEVKKLYNPNNEEDDPAEMEEEFHRMREHVFNETDKNKDGLISLEEFLKMTEQQDFQKDEGWKDLDEQTVFSDAELEEFMKNRHQMLPPLEHPQYGDPRAYYNVPNAPMQGVPPHINYKVPPGGMPPQPGYPDTYGAGHPPPYQQQYQGGHPQQQFQAGYPQHQQQFQGGHPQQQQFQAGHPQQQQFQAGHPQQQQFQAGHPQQPQFQAGHPQQPQFQAGQPQQQYPGGQQQQHPSGQQQQYPSGQQQQQHPSGQQQQHPSGQQQHLVGNQQVQSNIQGVGSNKAVENNQAANKNAPDASNSINQIPNNVKPNVPQEAAAQVPASNKQVPPQTQP